MKYLKLTVIIITTILLSSCRPEPIEIQLDEYVPEPVVFTKLLENGTTLITLTKSKSALKYSKQKGDTLSQSLIESLVIKDAEVSITHKGQKKDLLSTNQGLYFTTLPLVENEDYHLKIVTPDDKILTSTTRVLPKVDFKSISPIIIRTEKDTSVKIRFSIEDKSEDNWYLLNFYALPKYNSTGADLNLSSLISNTDLNVKTILLSDESFVNSIYQDTILVEGINVNDTLITSLTNINKSYYDFLQSQIKSKDLINQLAKEPVSTISNIKGGLGFFNLQLTEPIYFDLNKY